MGSYWVCYLFQKIFYRCPQYQRESLKTRGTNPGFPTFYVVDQLEANSELLGKLGLRQSQSISPL
ncbi:hypothetical protein SAMN05216328_11748 [Ensifer sp. YR511]|nr:hypothetical protein SAMN05216328_11748 [Ensifer sp. YR511]